VHTWITAGRARQRCATASAARNDGWVGSRRLCVIAVHVSKGRSNETRQTPGQSQMAKASMLLPKTICFGLRLVTMGVQRGVWGARAPHSTNCFSDRCKVSCKDQHMHKPHERHCYTAQVEWEERPKKDGHWRRHGSACGLTVSMQQVLGLDTRIRMAQADKGLTLRNNKQWQAGDV